MKPIHPLFVPKDTIRRRCATPLDMGDGKIGVLGIHGYTGYPGELAYLAKGLTKAGYHVMVPRLPGHGTIGEDFARTGMHDWLNTVVEAYIELHSQHDQVYVIGHSMGGALALILSSIFPVEKLVLLAPAVDIKMPGKKLLRFLAKFMKAPKKVSWKQQPEFIFFDDRDADDDSFLGSEYWSWHRVPQMAELAALMAFASNKRRLKRVSAKTLVITGGKDVVVPEEATILLDTKLPEKPERLHYAESSHFIPYDVDCEEILQEIIRFYS